MCQQQLGSVLTLSDSDKAGQCPQLHHCTAVESDEEEEELGEGNIAQEEADSVLMVLMFSSFTELLGWVRWCFEVSSEEA
jgi:hypothetical protein